MSVEQQYEWQPAPPVERIQLTMAQASFVKHEVAIAQDELRRANERAAKRMKTFLTNVVKLPRGAEYRILTDETGMFIEYTEPNLKVVP